MKSLARGPGPRVATQPSAHDRPRPSSASVDSRIARASGFVMAALSLALVGGCPEDGTPQSMLDLLNQLAGGIAADMSSGDDADGATSDDATGGGDGADSGAVQGDDADVGTNGDGADGTADDAGGAADDAETTDASGDDADESEPSLNGGADVQFVAGRLLIKFRDVDNASQERILAEHGAHVAGEIPQIGVKIVELPEQAGEMAHLRAFRQRPDVEFAELDQIVPPAATPDDPKYSTQWHLPKIDAPTAWDTTTGGSDVIIAILDSGCDPTHPDLAPKYVAGWNFYDENDDTSDVTGHGTAVAGQAAAIGNNSTGVASPAWSCPIMPLRITDTSGTATTQRMAAALVWAADRGVRVANLSFCLSGTSSTLSNGAKYFQEHGGVVTTSAGNNGDFVSTLPDDPYLLLMSGTDSNDAIASWSSTGTNIDLCAPGQNIATTTRGGTYGAGSGTSAAAAVTAGVAALVYSANPTLTGVQVQDILEQSADDLGSNGWDQTYGWGRVNAARAVALALQTEGGGSGGGSADTTAPTVIITSPVGGTKIGNSLSVSASASDDVGVSKVELYVDGALKATDSSSPYSFSMNTRKWSRGTHSLLCRAYDAAGNVGVSATVSVYK
jgi:subtilisin family serine protease